MSTEPRAAYSLLSAFRIAGPLLLLLATPLAAQKRLAPVRTWSLEAERLVDRAQSSETPPVVQAMAQFGPGWGGDAQLFWAPERDGAFLRLLPSAPRSGRFDVLLVVTTAPDFARFEVSLDGAPEIEVEGYSARVARREVDLGTHTLAAGEHELLLRIAGRDPASAGRRVGLDRLVLTLAGEPPPASLPGVGSGSPSAVAPRRSLPAGGGARATARSGLAAALSASALPAGARLRALRPGQAACPDPSLCYEPGSLLFLPSGAADTQVRFEWDVRRVPRAAGVVWQVARQAFPPGSTLLSARELVASGTATGLQGGFEVDASAAASEAAGGLPALQVRIVPLTAGTNPKAAGRPSETIRILRAQRSTTETHIEVESRLAPKLTVTRFEWVPLTTTPHWPPGCKDEPEEDEGLFEKIVGAVEDAWNWAVEAYADAKSAVVDVVAFALPVVPRGALEIALDGALMAAGIPPDIPDLDRLMSDGADVLANELAAQIPVPEGLTGAAVEALREQVRRESHDALLDAAEEIRRQAAEAHLERCITKVDDPYLRVSIRNDGAQVAESWTFRVTDDATPPLYRPFELPVTHLAAGETRVYPIPLTDPRDWNVIPGPRSQMPDWDRGRDLETWWRRALASSFRFRVTSASRIDCVAATESCRATGTDSLFEAPSRAWWNEARTPWPRAR